MTRPPRELPYASDPLTLLKTLLKAAWAGKNIALLTDTS